MHRNTLFWGSLLILLGVVFLLDNLGILPVRAWQVIWPVFLVALGLWILFGSLLGQRAVYTKSAVVPLEGATRASVQVNHGAGRLRISAGAGTNNLIEGDFNGGLDLSTRREGDILKTKMSVPFQFFPFGPWNWGPRGLDWSFVISREIPVTLTISSGAGEAQIDLSELLVPQLRLQTGASSSSIILPANAGYTKVDIEAGAASIRISVPPGVAARILNRSGLSSLNMDTSRFPRQGGIYASIDYDTAPNKVELDIRTGIGAVEVR